LTATTTGATIASVAARAAYENLVGSSAPTSGPAVTAVPAWLALAAKCAFSTVTATAHQVNRGSRRERLGQK
jgi:hypothetical protein